MEGDVKKTKLTLTWLADITGLCLWTNCHSVVDSLGVSRAGLSMSLHVTGHQ